MFKDYTFNLIIKYKKAIICSLVGIFIIAALLAPKNKITDNVNQNLPYNHPQNELQREFEKKFSVNNNTIIIGTYREKIFSNFEFYEKWWNLEEELKKDSLVLSNGEMIKKFDFVISEFSAPIPIFDHKQENIQFRTLFNKKFKNQQELTLVSNQINNFPFYTGTLVSREEDPAKKISLIVIQLNHQIKESKPKEIIIQAIQEKFEKLNNTETDIHISGFEYIRFTLKEKVKEEVILFIFASILIMSIIIFLLFKNWKILLSTWLLVIMITVISLATIVLLDYEITGIMSLIPTLLIIISIPNCIYYINYLQLRQEKNNYDFNLSLKETFQHISKISFLTNITTAIGFLSFVTTKNQILTEFGIIAGLNIFILFILSNLLLTITFHYLQSVPRIKDSYFNRKIEGFSKKIIILNKKPIYIATSIAILITLFSLPYLESDSSLTNDLKKENNIKQDLMFFEEHLSGVIPVNILIKSEKKITKEKDFRQIQEIQTALEQKTPISKTTSISDLSSFLRQSFYDLDPKEYQPIKDRESVLFDTYLSNSKGLLNKNPNNALIDATKKETRIAFFIKDKKTKETQKILNTIKETIDPYLQDKEYRIISTAYANILGIEFLTKNIFQSICFSILIIASIIYNLFRSFKIALIAIICNIIPLIITLGLITACNIPLKPATLIIFNIAFGISIDDTIHFLSKLKLKITEKDAIIKTIQETGLSMINTSIILFCGFIIFLFSTFQSTAILGGLISFTLFNALIINLTILPSLLKKFIVPRGTMN